MRPSCWRTHSLLLRRAEGLTEPERLLIEEHLASCAACASDASLLDRMSDAVRSGHRDLSAPARRRIVARALLRSGTPAAPIHPRPTTWRVAIAMAMAAAAATAMAIVAMVWAWPRPDALLLQANTGVAPGLLHGAALVHPAQEPSPAPADTPPAAELVEALTGARVEAGPARIDALEPSTFRWIAVDDTLELVSGAIRVDVTPGPARRYRVATPRFIVEVTGTSFEVDMERVRVQHGRVRVLAPEAGELLAELGPAQHWSSSSAPPRTGVASADVDARIADARRRLASGRAAEARALLQPLVGQPLARRQLAETRSLLAECALAEGDYDGAARAYGEVASAHGDTLAGETALFAQARAEMRAGRKEAARTTLRRYLDRFPHGRFRKEALDHLRTLTEGP